MTQPRKWILNLVALLLSPGLIAACGDVTIPQPTNSTTDAGAYPSWRDLDQDGDGFTPNQGDCNDHDRTTYPGAPEQCDGVDHACNGHINWLCDIDGDGYPYHDAHGTVVDCNDNDKLVNPGAFEVQANLVDDDCDGLIDEIDPPCDGDLRASNATAFAGAIEICAPWLLSAEWVGQPDPSQAAQLSDFGNVYKPLAGSSFILLSTGIAADENDPGFVKPRPGTRFSNPDVPNPAPMNGRTNICDVATTDERSVHDYVELKLRLKVPTNALWLSFNFNFFSSEYWAGVGGQTNDKFLVLLDSQGYQGNISLDGMMNPITVNSAFFGVCQSHSICDGKKQNVCTHGNADLAGTGYEMADQNGTSIGGATGWLTTTMPMTPGETATLRFIIFDEGDHLGDSSVLIDNFQWSNGVWRSPLIPPP